MPAHRLLFLTKRAPRHQQQALEAAPRELAVTMMRDATKAQVVELLPEVEFLITERNDAIDADMIAAGKNLRLIQRLGSQTHDIDRDAARAAGIPVCCWPIRTCVMVAEHMILQLLMLAKRTREVMYALTQVDSWSRQPEKCDENYFAYNWTDRRDVSGLYRGTVGILGYGEVGAELARRLGGFACERVLYNKRQPLPSSVEAELGIHFADLATIRAESDFLCVLLPYYSNTEALINGEFLAGMKPGACLVSCGAGGILDEAAVARAVQTGHLSGAATDTFVYVPISAGNPLLGFAADPSANVVLTPHTASGTISDWEALRVEDYANVVAVLKGQPLRYRVA